MEVSAFYRLGKLIYHFRWPIIGLWILLSVTCLPFMTHITEPFKITGFFSEKSKSEQVKRYLNKELNYNNYNKLFIIYTSKNLLATSVNYTNKVKKSLSGIKNFPLKTIIIYPNENKKQISKDKHTSYVVVIIKSQNQVSDKLLNDLKSLIKTPKNMTIQIGGEPIFIDDVNKQTQTDLYKADFIATPISLITLILVFGTLISALLPIILGGGSALVILTVLYLFGHFFSLSVFTLNIALLLGLCLSLDYALFVISRFRDELKNRLTVVEAVAVTQATAGKAILFSGFAVFASLSALLLFPINILFSIAIGGLTAVFIAVLMAIILLPVILSVLGQRIDLLSIRLFKKSRVSFNFWHWLAEKVVHRPILYFFSILGFLLLLGYPFISAKFGVSDFHIFPNQSEHRVFFNNYENKFDINELTPILVLLQAEHNRILSKNNIKKIYDLAHQLEDDDLIKKVISVVNTDSSLTQYQYYSLYNFHKGLISQGVKKLLETTTRHYLTVMTIISRYSADSPQTRSLINKLQSMPIKKGINKQLTGTPVSNIDLLNCISQILPYAILWIMVSSYVILLILLRSVILPLKAILMNILSLCACYGALVMVFQEGYLHSLLNFEPQGFLDISLLVIIFCALFGFSMDYEVFLLTRIKESYELYGDNKASIIFGIEKSSKIITSAAIIVMCICFSFLVADILIVKAFGLGIAVAIFVDAFLIRTFLVPATMILLKQFNWYLPKWVDKILPTL
ncbi:MMPL family transporter [Tatlockia micdadei]|uniref:MMPL family transporter n=1 Tax=Legionella micdadei TaxID=451 RepID=UPI00156E098F|nr:MMPL family transporter [Legionella micdadei]NSL18806.1 MMPL family transporter [Legionella micdadei]